MRRGTQVLLIASAGLLLAGCGPNVVRAPQSTTAPSYPAQVPDAVPGAEPRSTSGNPSFYDVFGQRYFVLGRFAAHKNGYLEFFRHQFCNSLGSPVNFGAESCLIILFSLDRHLLLDG